VDSVIGSLLLWADDGVRTALYWAAGTHGRCVSRRRDRAWFAKLQGDRECGRRKYQQHGDSEV